MLGSWRITCSAVWPALSTMSELSGAEGAPQILPDGTVDIHIGLGTSHGFLVVDQIKVKLQDDIWGVDSVMHGGQRLACTSQGTAVDKVQVSVELGRVIFASWESGELGAFEITSGVNIDAQSRRTIQNDVLDFDLRCEFPRSTLAVLQKKTISLYLVCAEDTFDNLIPSATVSVSGKPFTSCHLCDKFLVCGNSEQYSFYSLERGTLSLVHEKSMSVLKESVIPVMSRVVVPEERGGLHHEVLLLQHSSHPFFQYKVSAVPMNSVVFDVRRTVSLLTAGTAPSSIVGVGPFILCVQECGIEVYHVESCKLVQTIYIPRITALSISSMLEGSTHIPSYLWDDDCPFTSSGTLQRFFFAFTETGVHLLSFGNLRNLEAQLRQTGKQLGEGLRQYMQGYNVSPLPVPTSRRKRFGDDDDQPPTQSSELWFMPYYITTPLLDLDQLRSKAHWEPDSSRTACAGNCGHQFSGILVSGKHHCRKCGRVFCGTCCKVVSGEDILAMGYVGANVKHLRLCIECVSWCDKNIYVLLLYERYREAIEYARERSRLVLGYSTNNYIGNAILEHLMNIRDYEQCAELLFIVIQRDVGLWEEWTMRFFEARVIRQLLPHIPNPSQAAVGETLIILDASIYTMILCHLVREDPEMLYTTARKWKTAATFDVSSVLCAMEGYLFVRRQDLLQKAGRDPHSMDSDDLASVGSRFITAQVDYIVRTALFLHRQYSTSETVLRFYVNNYYVYTPLECQEGLTPSYGVLFDVPSFIEQCDLWHTLLPPNSLLRPIARRHRSVMAQSVLSILNRKPTLKVEDFVEQLAPYPEERLVLLHTLTEAEVASTRRYHNTLIELYVKYYPEGLLSFVQQKDLNNIDWKSAAELTKGRRMYREYAYILGRMGNYAKALHVICRNLKDVKYGLEYIENVGDEDGSLREAIVSHVRQSPVLISEFIRLTTDNPSVVSVSEFLRSIPGDNKLKVPNSAALINEAFVVSNADRNIHSITMTSIDRSSFNLFASSHEKKLGAVSIDIGDGPETTRCALCRGKLSGVKNIFVAACSHAFHVECIQSTFSGVSMDKVQRPPRRAIKKSGPTVTRLSTNYIERLNSEPLFVYELYEMALEVEHSDIMNLLPYHIARYVATFLDRSTRHEFTFISKSWHTLMMDSLYGPYEVRHCEDPIFWNTHNNEKSKVSGALQLLSDTTRDGKSLYFRLYGSMYSEPKFMCTPAGVPFYDSQWYLKSPVHCVVCSMGTKR
eukprot:PhF_6_TR37551/c0_g1_i1/m.55624/K20184/VPS41; vacuolar protein sorting-associated protein 41